MSQATIGQPVITRFAYRVITLRETLMGGKQKGSQLEQELNQAGAQGWRLHSVTKADVPGRMMGHTEGLLVVLEQPYS
jgi:hypothetical protein